MPRGCKVDKCSVFLFFVLPQSPGITLSIFVMIIAFSLSSHSSVVGHMYLIRLNTSGKTLPLLEVPCNRNIPRLLITEQISFYAARHKVSVDAYLSTGLVSLPAFYFTQCQLPSFCDAHLFWTELLQVLKGIKFNCWCSTNINSKGSPAVFKGC